MNTFPLEKPAAVTRNLLLCCARCLSLVPTRTKQIIFFRCVQKSVLKKYRRRMKTKTSYFPTTTLVSVKPKIIIPGPGLLLYISTTGQQVQMQSTHRSLRSTHHPSFVHPALLSRALPTSRVESSSSLAYRRSPSQSSSQSPPYTPRLYPRRKVHHAFIRMYALLPSRSSQNAHPAPHHRTSRRHSSLPMNESGSDFASQELKRRGADRRISRARIRNSSVPTAPLRW